MQLKPKGVTTTVLLAKAIALALARHPIMNACCPDGTSFHYNTSINIAVAVAMDGGLITPVLPDADKVPNVPQHPTASSLHFGFRALMLAKTVGLPGPSFRAHKEWGPEEWWWCLCRLSTPCTSCYGPVALRP